MEAVDLLRSVPHRSLRTTVREVIGRLRSANDPSRDWLVLHHLLTALRSQGSALISIKTLPIHCLVSFLIVSLSPELVAGEFNSQVSRRDCRLCLVPKSGTVFVGRSPEAGADREFLPSVNVEFTNLTLIFSFSKGTDLWDEEEALEIVGLCQQHLMTLSEDLVTVRNIGAVLKLSAASATESAEWAAIISLLASSVTASPDSTSVKDQVCEIRIHTDCP